MLLIRTGWFWPLSVILAVIGFGSEVSGDCGSTDHIVMFRAEEVRFHSAFYFRRTHQGVGAEQIVPAPMLEEGESYEG